MPAEATTVDKSQPSSAVTTCPACGGGEWREAMRAVPDYITGEQFDIVRCAGCGMGVTRPVPEDLGKYYPRHYRVDRHGFTARLRTRLRARQLLRQFPRDFKGRLLDAGCGDGSFALHMKELGWEVAATEINPAIIEDLSAKGIKAAVDAERDRVLDGGGFDAVTCWHVLEHVARPAEFAAWVRTALKPQGLFLAAVPNWMSWQARMTGAAWLHLDVPRHLYHFHEPSLRQFLSRQGFAVRSMERIALEYDWLGAIQSPLNACCRHRNLLFERLTGAHRNWTNPPRKTDVLLTALLTPPLAALTFPGVYLDALLGGGATLQATAVPA